MNKLKRIVLVLIALMAFCRLRIFLYRALLGYDISYDWRIGPGNFLFLDTCCLRGARVGRFNYMDARHLEMEPGCETIITRRHSFDLADTVSIGDDVTFGGTSTEVWTHGFDLHRVRLQAPLQSGITFTSVPGALSCPEWRLPTTSQSGPAPWCPDPSRPAVFMCRRNWSASWMSVTCRSARR